MMTLELLKKELAVATLQQKLGKEVTNLFLCDDHYPIYL